MNEELKHDGIDVGVFVGQKKASGEVKNVTEGFKVNCWGAMVRFKKTFEMSTSHAVHYGSGWALNWFLELFGKELFNLKSMNIQNGKDLDGKWRSIIEAEYYMTGLTSEDDVEQWARDRIEQYRAMQVTVGGYTYYHKTDSWDTAEIIGEIRF